MLEPKEEDEEFVVIKAGPPLPIRRPRKSLPLTPQCDYKRKVPLYTATSPTPPIQAVSATPLSNKVTQTFLVKSPAAVVLRSRPQTPTLTNVESKVKQYIEQVKKFDEENRSMVRTKPDKVLSLEDLYQVSTTVEIKDNGQVEEKLRETLRIIKEKDEMINKLRESCHDLKLKWADAENRVDEIRFGIGIGEKDQPRSLGQEGGIIGMNYVKRSFSDVNLSSTTSAADVEVKGQNNKTTYKNTKDQATETDQIFDTTTINKVRCSLSKKSQPTSEEYDLGEFDLESRYSQFDPVLEEKCSNWLEKVQNWKIDSANNVSQDKDKDSCGDRDSGFRGSAELEAHPPISRKSRNSHHHRLSKSSSTKAKYNSKIVNKNEESSLQNTETIPTSSKSPTPERHVQWPIMSTPPPLHMSMDTKPNLLSSSHPLRSSSFTEEEQEQSGPPSLQIAPPWLTFSSNVNPQSSTVYEGFPSFTSSSSRKYENYGTKSMESLNNYRRYPDLDLTFQSSEADHHQLLRNIEKRFKTLNPLLDDATSIALRVKRKSENLAKLLRDKNAIDRHRLSFS